MSFRSRLLLSLAFLAFALPLLCGQNSKPQPGKAELATKAAADAATLATKTEAIATKSQAEMDKILAARTALFSQLPVYLEEKLQAASALNPGTFDLFQKADVNEVDHSSSIDQTSDDLWSNMMQEDVFFANDLNGRYPIADYKIKWIGILEAKANLSTLARQEYTLSHSHDEIVEH
jgi:hypothetical protein